MAGGDDDAISVLDKLGGEYLNCTICHDRFKHPKILNCLHSFCEDCLLRYQPSQGIVKLKCPVCRQDTVILEGGVTGLRTNFPLRGLVEAFRQQGELLASGRSSPVPGERTQTPPPHRITVSDCRKHPGERTWFYCDPCQELVCRVCTAKTHRDHEFQEIDTAALVSRETLKDFFPRIVEMLSMVEASLDATKTDREWIASEAERCRLTLDSLALDAVARVMDAKQKILDEINTTEMERAKARKEQVKSLTVLRDRVRHSLAVSEHLTTASTDMDLLSLFPIIQNDLKDLMSHEDVSPPKDSPSFMKLIPAAEPIFTLGKLVVDTEKWRLTKRVGKFGVGKEDFDAVRGLAVCTDGGIAVADMGLWTKGITFFSSEWTYRTSIKFSSTPRDVTSVNDNIVVVDNTDSVKIYNAEREMCFEFPTTPPGDEAKAPVNIVSVSATSTGSVVVGDVQRNVITEHRWRDGTVIRSIPTAVPPYFIAVGANGNLLISGLNMGEIEENDGSGTRVLAVTPVIAEEQVSCRGVCYAADGQSFYAVLHGKESNIGHVHRYSSTGDFLGCMASDLYDPNGITLTSRGELAVADCFSVKVYEQL